MEHEPKPRQAAGLRAERAGLRDQCHGLIPATMKQVVGAHLPLVFKAFYPVSGDGHRSVEGAHLSPVPGSGDRILHVPERRIRDGDVGRVRIAQVGEHGRRHPGCTPAQDVVPLLRQHAQPRREADVPAVWVCLQGRRQPVSSPVDWIERGVERAAAAT